jgi:hypothetical protein
VCVVCDDEAPVLELELEPPHAASASALSAARPSWIVPVDSRMG